MAANAISICVKNCATPEVKYAHKFKKKNRKVQGVTQSQIAANARRQEEDKKDKN